MDDLDEFASVLPRESALSPVPEDAIQRLEPIDETDLLALVVPATLVSDTDLDDPTLHPRRPGRELHLDSEAIPL